MRPPRLPADDRGFTLMETLIAMAIIGIVMTAVTSLFVSVMSVTGNQSGRQVAVQFADDGMELVRATKGSALAEDRNQSLVNVQWAGAPAVVLPYLADMAVPTSSGSATGTPTIPLSDTDRLNGVDYTRTFYIGRCWQAQKTGGACGATQPTNGVEFFRVVIAVTWADKRCPSALCAYITSTLVSNDPDDPTFSAEDPPPNAARPADQAGTVNIAATLQLTATDGSYPLTWTVTGLPSPMTATNGGLITGAPATAGTYTVTATVTDAGGRTSSVTFGWKVNPTPTVVDPGPMTTDGGVATSLAMTTTGGTSPFTWAASNLPAGLSIGAGTGIISGTPTAVGTRQITVTATDAVGATASRQVTWTVPALSITRPAAQSDEATAPFAGLQVVAAGGIQPYTWSASGLPPGLSIDATGFIDGVPTTPGTYSNAKITVTDSTGTAATTAAFAWTITPGPTITNSAASRSNNVNDVMNLPMAATGGSGGYTWSAANLPAGLSISSSTGRITGTISAGTRYITTITAVDSAGGTDTYTFTWNVGQNANSLRVTNPTGDVTSARNVATSLTATAQAGSSSGYTWSATGLPTGLSMTTGGVISGTPTVAGAYTVKLVVKDSSNKTATYMLTWTVT